MRMGQRDNQSSPEIMMPAHAFKRIEPGEMAEFAPGSTP